MIGQKISINFIDFEKAFDSVHRPTLWAILRHYGVPQQFVDAFRCLYSNSRCCVRTDDGCTAFFKINTGVRQGCVLSPFLFLLVIDFIMRRSVDQAGIGVPWHEARNLTDLDFADDIALLGSTQEDLQKLTAALQREATKVGLRISGKKTKVLRVGYARARIPVMINQQRAEEVENFTYLGSIISNDGVCDRDVDARVGKAVGVLRCLQPIWNSTSLNVRVKIRLLNSIVFPTALYASETWCSTKHVHCYIFQKMF
uniref:Reverse transcriptase domain-containing protein n=1 Tax=Maylandia zebra TaxID=106582 RepID=A0A3P9BVE3_9CICH